MKHNNHTFIDSESFEIIPDSEIIEVDDDIAEAISILNKKGYKTEYCCSGHISANKYYSMICDKCFLNEEKLKEDFIEYYICDVTDKRFKIIYPKTRTSIYIKFTKDYKFKNLPKGFEKVPIWDESQKEFSKTEFDTIEHIIDYYQDNKVRDNKYVYNEIKDYNKLLLDWVKELPLNKNWKEW